MGVDISFHIEVRKKGKWHALAWQIPKALENEPAGDGDWVTHHCRCTFRHYHIEYFLQNKAVFDLPDDVTAETLGCLGEHGSKGWFFYSDFVEYLNEKKECIFETLSRCREMEVINRLDRIERLARGEEVPIADDCDVGDFSIREIVEDYEDSIVFLKKLYWVVRVLTDDLDVEDTRIIYEVW